jgi:hypothetical protein
MIFKPSVLIIGLALSLSAVAAEETLFVEETDATGEELRVLQKIAEYDNAFHISTHVKRYYRVHPETHVKQPVLIELVFPKKDNLYFDEFMSYAVSIDPDTSVVNYSYDAGTASRGLGTVLVSPSAVIQTDRSCGLSACTVQITRNGKVLYEGTE